MRTTHFRDLLVHLFPQKTADGAWCPRALIEDPKSGEVVFVTMTAAVDNEQSANIKMMLEAHTRIREDTWRVHAGRKQTVSG